MDLPILLRAVFGLAVTLGLVGLAAYAARRWGPPGLLQARDPSRPRRLRVVESLALSPTHRLVLVAVDGAERLVLLGEGRLEEAASSPAAARHA